MANLAVYFMEMGQPALLYLVPCTLGTMCYLGRKRQELRQLWDGPRVLETANSIVYGNNDRSGETSSRSGDPGAVANETSESDSFEDECGDVPLLATKKSARNDQ